MEGQGAELVFPRKDMLDDGAKALVDNGRIKRLVTALRSLTRARTGFDVRCRVPIEEGRAESIKIDLQRL